MLSSTLAAEDSELTREQTIELTIIIPAFNEAGTIIPNLRELIAWLAKSMAEIRAEILVIDDGSRDGMAETIKQHELCRNGMIRVVSHKVNMGRGRAIRTGFEHARGAYIVCLDADLSYAPMHIPSLIEPLWRDEADITLASAYHPQGKVTNVPWTRAVLSRWGNRVLSAGVYGRFSTLTCMVRGYTRAAVEQLELTSSGKDLHLEIVQKANLLGLRIAEIPAHLHWRNRKRRAAGKKRWVDYVPFLAMSGSIAQHLIFNYVLRPGSLLMWPVWGLFLTSLIGIWLLLFNWMERLFAGPEALSAGKVYSTFRQTLVDGSLTLQLSISAMLLGLIFIAFYFASQQNKKNFEELYIMLNRMNDRIKTIEKRQDS